MALIRPYTPATYNVVAGWLGCGVPPMPKHRRRPHRKTNQRRGDGMLEKRSKRQAQLLLRA